MKKIFLGFLIIVAILYSSAEKKSKSSKNSFHQPRDENYPDIVESVHSDLPEVPQIKIRMVNAEEDDGDADATISLDAESDNEEEEEEDDDLPIKQRKLPKAKPEDIHTFL